MNDEKDTTEDLLQIKINEAKNNLPPITLEAIDRVDWRKEILELRNKKGFTFEQLGDLELETELVLCGLENPENYAKRLAKEMNISEKEAEELANEMNTLVFSKIKNELIKISEEEKSSVKINVIKNIPIQTTSNTGKNIESPKTESIHKEMLPIPEKLEINSAPIHEIFREKLNNTIQTNVVNTDHSLNNITKTTPNGDVIPKTHYPPKADPYRLSPDE